VALLYDTLNHPDADTGQDLPSLLTWKYHPDQAIDHVVLGRGPTGGSWQVLQYTLSLHSSALTVVAVRSRSNPFMLNCETGNLSLFVYMTVQK
jgi:hypothetical protein